MANAVMMYEALGKGEDFPPRAVTRRGIEKLLMIHEHEAYCQPCVSPIWFWLEKSRPDETPDR